MTPAATRPDPAVEEAAEVLGPLARRDAPLAPSCTYRVGGPASLLVEVSTVDGLDAVHRAVARSGLPVLVVGRGSNLLVADRGFRGIAVHLGDVFSTIDIDVDGAGGAVLAGGAALMPVVARQTARAGLTGFEWAVGVPGSIGGGVRMNAGGHGSEVAASLVAADVYDLVAGDLQRWPAARLELGYRRSSLAAGQLVLSAELRLAAGDPDRSAAEIADIVRWRRTHQPGGQNAGSVFANPPGDSAGRLIEAAGLKGHRLGTAEVSERHANFIQADPDGRADDVAALMVLVQRTVLDRFGVLLRPENLLVGFPDERRPLREEDA